MNKDFVPAEGENIVLGNTTNLHQGARPVDATDDVHPSYIALVEGAIALFPGLMMAGVDIAIENASVPAGENYHLSYAAHHNPSKGKPRDVAGAIVNYLMGRWVGMI
jgi:cyanophycin synthetase